MALTAQGEEVTSAMLDCVVAACAQMGDTGRMLETFEAYPALGLKANAQAYNICIGAFIRNSLQDRLQFVRPSGPVMPGMLGHSAFACVSVCLIKGRDLL